MGNAESALTPEIIRNVHSPSCSSPLFVGSDPIKIYTMVLHGIDKMDFPKKIGKRPDDLIRRLCKYKDKSDYNLGIRLNKTEVISEVVYGH